MCHRGARGGDSFAIVGATASLFISSAGAGLLSYPYAAQQQGIAVTIATTVCFAVVSVGGAITISGREPLASHTTTHHRSLMATPTLSSRRQLTVSDVISPC